MKIKSYQRDNAVKYAKKWAYTRNPLYYNFDKIGGDCTNFVSQCIFAGCKTMNYSPNGWYYLSVNDRAPSWTSVEFLYKFLTTNNGIGPSALVVNKENILLGDVVQLGNSTKNFYHTCIITGFDANDLLLSCHTRDFYNRPLSTYSYENIRYLHIEQVK